MTASGWWAFLIREGRYPTFREWEAIEGAELIDTPMLGFGQQPLTAAQKALLDREGFRPSRLLDELPESAGDG